MKLVRLAVLLFAIMTDFALRAESTSDPTTSGVPAEKPATVVFFGDSITSGFGMEPSETYPALIQTKIDALGWPYRTVNAGLSGDTTAAGTQRLRWVMKQGLDVLVLALGGNDGLRGVPTGSIEKNLQSLIDLARAANPDVRILLAGMKMPANYGKDYRDRFAKIFSELAAENDLPLVPFLLEGVGGVPRLNFPDRIHPTAEGHRLIADTVWKELEPILRERLPTD